MAAFSLPDVRFVVGKIFMTDDKQNNELTDEELAFYGNYGYTQGCTCCGHDAPIHKYDFFHERNNDNYIEYNGVQFLCCKCI